ncbi:hypothetical protein T459_02369 [Capsicum annuum]|uniref:Beta-ketoacyl-[acyl-carrier-protein] synthase III C-terminal domain-containing protein n=1 Tax=Capsicum annuum TaxID=4072 RepID=A0A2G3AJS3_CAPAN|nr:hypothetical protein T459_02369 [Capsicum annuum]
MNGILEALTQTRASYTVLNRISGHRACPPPDVPLAGELSIAILAPYAWFRSTLPSELPLPESGRVATRLAVPSEHVISNLASYGNTSATSIPLALDEAVRSGKVQAVHVIAAARFVAGLVISLSLWFVAEVLQWRTVTLEGVHDSELEMQLIKLLLTKSSMLEVTGSSLGNSLWQKCKVRLISFGKYDILVAEKLLALFNSMKFTCLSEGKGYHFPPCHIVNICGFRVLIDCHLDLSALAVFSPLSTVISSLFDERTSNDRGQSLSSSSAGYARVTISYPKQRLQSKDICNGGSFQTRGTDDEGPRFHAYGVETILLT